MRNFVFYQKNCVHSGSVGTSAGAAASTIKESMEQTKFNLQKMSGST